MDAEFVLKNASIIEGTGIAPYKGHIHVVGGEIKAVIKEDSKVPKEKIEIIDLKGQTVMPGLIDAHCHISFDEPVSNDELFFHRREGLASIIAGTNALNTDIVLQLSADNGSNFSTATLTALPDFSSGIKMAKVNDLSVTAGTQLKYKISFANQSSGSKEARIRGVSLNY